MDKQNFSVLNAFSSGPFGLWKKWFWVGIAIAITSANVIAGLIYGIALALEKEYRREGLIIIIFTFAWFAVAAYWLGPWLIKAGVLPHYQLLKVK